MLLESSILIVYYTWQSSVLSMRISCKPIALRYAYILFFQSEKSPDPSNRSTSVSQTSRIDWAQIFKLLFFDVWISNPRTSFVSKNLGSYTTCADMRSNWHLRLGDQRSIHEIEKVRMKDWHWEWTSWRFSPELSTMEVSLSLSHTLSHSQSITTTLTSRIGYDRRLQDNNKRRRIYTSICEVKTHHNRPH